MKLLKSKCKPALLFSLVLYAICLHSQGGDPMRVTLLDGDEVDLYKQYSLGQKDNAFLFAPFNLRLSVNEGKTEFSFMAYRQDSTTEIMGGILHFLLTWGPTEDQNDELEDLVQARTDSSHYVVGGLPLEYDKTMAGLEIGPTDHPLAQLLLRGLKSSSIPPLQPGGKMAASFSFSAADAQKMASLLPDKEAWQEVWLRIQMKSLRGGFMPTPPSSFFITTSFASCLESL